MFENIGSAFSSIWSNKVRSLLTLLGVVIGVTSVTILVALGEGLKKDVSALIQGLGTNVIAVISGKVDAEGGPGAGANPANFISGDILTLKDVESIDGISGVAQVVPMSILSGNLKYEDKTAYPTLFGTYPNFLETMEIVKLEKGRMFSSRDETGGIVLSNANKKVLFGNDEALGKKIKLGQKELEVIGVLGKAKSSSLLSSEYDNLSLVSFAEAKIINKDQVKVSRIVAKAKTDTDVKVVKKQIEEVMLRNHNGEEDFTVLTQDEMLGLFDQFLSLATAMVSAIAAISLVVGGIGIMNIMLVTVTERTREIGLRKAVGATRGAILVQFLTEAVVITLVGGLIGLGIAFLVAKIVELKTPLKPAFSLEVLALTAGISLIIGAVFGLWPALRAAKKDPIEALRYE